MLVQKIFSSIFAFIQGLFNPKNYTLHNLTVFVIVLMCIQYIPIETRAGVSPVKVAVMAVMPLVLLAHLHLNKALILGTIYIAWLFITGAVIHADTFRASTVLYSAMFMVTYIVVYTAIWNYRVFTIRDFCKILRVLFYVLAGVLMAQQVCLLVGAHIVPILNLCQNFDRGLGANSLTFEPSTYGRLSAILYYAILKCNEYERGHKITITEIFKGDLKWVTILYIYALLTMGSGTAFIAAGILSLYFMKGPYFFLAIPIFVGVYFILEKTGNESFVRAQQASIAMMSSNPDDVRDVDQSAAARIAPFLNTIKSDFSSEEFWIGKGCDSTTYLQYETGQILMGHIDDYGMISLILEYIIVFTCCIRFRSLETIFFITGIGGNISNVSYAWGILMIFTCLRFLYYNSKVKQSIRR